VPPKVEYRLTHRGESLRPVVKAMCRWGVREMEEGDGAMTTREKCSRGNNR
jgi:DNA-binding HxlR family transcriptional regulator